MAIKENEIKELSEDYDDDNEVDVEWYPIPKGLKEAWDEIVKENGFQNK